MDRVRLAPLDPTYVETLTWDHLPEPAEASPSRSVCAVTRDGVWPEGMSRDG